MAYVQRDLILRMLEAVGAALARARRRKETGDLAGARSEIDAAITELLGHFAPLARRLDPRSAANIITDGRRLTAWGVLEAEDSRLLRDLQRPHEAAAAERRALERILEGWLRERSLDDDAMAVSRDLLTRVPTESLDARYREASATITSSAQA